MARRLLTLSSRTAFASRASSASKSPPYGAVLHAARGVTLYNAFCVALCAMLCVSCGKADGRAAAGTSPQDRAKAVYASAPLARKASTPTEGVYYCVFVRAFADSDGDGTGDFRGLTAKLDYLNDGDDRTTDDLGITGIWLMPVFASRSYHGYDVDDYYSLNPQYGTMEDFEALVSAAKSRGISVILDLTCNHSSSGNRWFMESKNLDSPYRSWYRWADADDKRYGFTRKIWGHDVWNRDGDSYYAALFDKSMPEFNLSTPEVRAEFRSIADFWLARGVSGFRFDAASHVFNQAELAPGEDGQTEALDFWGEYVRYIKSVKSDACTVAEVWEQTSTRAAFMKEIGSAFHFDLGTKIIDAIRSGDGGKNNLANSIAADLATYAAASPDYLDAPFLSNHDQNRIAGLLKGDASRLKLAASIYLLSEGLPFVYYGEEIGMMGAKPDEEIRTPMLWAPEGKDPLQTSWHSSKYNAKTVPVSVQANDQKSLLAHYRRLIAFRASCPALYKGRLSPLATDNSAVVSWMMSAAGGRAFVLHNFSDRTITVSLPDASFGADGKPMPLVFATYRGTKVTGAALTLPPLGSAVLSDSE